MARYKKLLKSKSLEKALKKYNTDKEKLNADSVNFQSIDDMDIGEHYLVAYSYDTPKIIPISKILWIRFFDIEDMKNMWLAVSDGYSQILFIEDGNNIDTILKMLCNRNKKLIYGENKDLKELFSYDLAQFRKLIALHPHEDAANIKVDPALLPVKAEWIPPANCDPVLWSAQNEDETKTPEIPEYIEEEIPYIPLVEQDLNSVVVPDDLPFAEEMNLLIHLAKKYPDDICIKFYEPVSAKDIDEFEARNNIKLTDELRRLFLFTNGFYLSSPYFDINSLNYIEKYLDTEWEWGDTKKYMYIGDRIGDGEIIILDYENENIITDDHGDETEYGDLTTLISDNIYTFLSGEYEDEKLEEYISNFEEDWS